MSHVTTVSTAVEFKDEAILIQALNECEGTVDTMVLDWYGAAKTVDHAIHSREFNNGIGFVRVGNKYEVRMDDYKHKVAAESLLKKIQMKYQKVSAVKRAKALGYSVRVTEGNTIRIVAKVY